MMFFLFFFFFLISNDIANNKELNVLFPLFFSPFSQIEWCILWKYNNPKQTDVSKLFQHSFNYVKLHMMLDWAPNIMTECLRLPVML